MIHTLQNAAVYNDRVYGLAIHTGFFATPLPPIFAADYRTQEGDELGTLFGITATTGFPIGMVNRIDYPNSNLKPVPDWPSISASFLDQEADVDIVPTVSFDTVSRTATINVELEWLKSFATDKFNIVAFVTEDNIVGTQLTHHNPAVDTAYVFNHLLRTSSNGYQGQPVGGTDITAGDKETYTTSVVLDAAWKEENCKILIYVYDINTQEIMQVVDASVM